VPFYSDAEGRRQPKLKGGSGSASRHVQSSVCQINPGGYAGGTATAGHGGAGRHLVLEGSCCGSASRAPHPHARSILGMTICMRQGTRMNKALRADGAGGCSAKDLFDCGCASLGEGAEIEPVRALAPQSDAKVTYAPPRCSAALSAPSMSCSTYLERGRTAWVLLHLLGIGQQRRIGLEHANGCLKRVGHDCGLLRPASEVRQNGRTNVGSGQLVGNQEVSSRRLQFRIQVRQQISHARALHTISRKDCQPTCSVP
jgi:hypothetical protein